MPPSFSHSLSPARRDFHDGDPFRLLQHSPLRPQAFLPTEIKRVLRQQQPRLLLEAAVCRPHSTTLPIQNGSASRPREQKRDQSTRNILTSPRTLNVASWSGPGLAQPTLRRRPRKRTVLQFQDQAEEEEEEERSRNE
jgi:hypothetical protein